MPTRKIHQHHSHHAPQRHAVAIPAYSSDLPTPAIRLPKTQTPASTAYQMVHEALQLDKSRACNLSAFDHFWSEPESERLIQETRGSDDPATIARLEQSCLSIFADLFHLSQTTGTCTASPTEAVQLAGLSMLRNWRSKRRFAGRSVNHPNFVLGTHASETWERFAQYCDVESRRIVCDSNHQILDPQQAIQAVDANTIGVVGVLGGALTGNFDPISELNDAIYDLNQQRGWNVPLHVEASQGGFVAPFLTPELKWDFQLPCVNSIHVSGRRYGLANPGIEWLLWRNAPAMDLMAGCLDQNSESSSSTTAAGVVAQYYNFLRLGWGGYSYVMQQLQDVADLLCRELRGMGRFEMISQEPCLPLVCFRLVDESRFTLFDVSAGLRERGWIVPAEMFKPANQPATALLRIVSQEGFDRQMAESFLKDLRSVLRNLDKHRSYRFRQGPHATMQPNRESIPA